MTRFSSIHESTTYEVTVRGIKSRAEAEAIVLAVERMPGASAWIPRNDFDANVTPAATEASEAPFKLPEALPANTVALLETVHAADADDNTGDLLAGKAAP